MLMVIFYPAINIIKKYLVRVIFFLNNLKNIFFIGNWNFIVSVFSLTIFEIVNNKNMQVFSHVKNIQVILESIKSAFLPR